MKRGLFELGRIAQLDRLPRRDDEAEAVVLMRVIARDAEPAYRVIQRLRAARLGLAAVIDSQRNLIGIVTGEDAIKRLVQVGRF